jgi:hypothetical protein
MDKSDLLHVVETDRYLLSILHDFDPLDPRDWDNLGTMVCSHGRYSLGDEQAENVDSYRNWDEWEAGEIPKGSVCLPLYLYDHSGITMDTKSFSCPWDSGQVGYIYCSPERIRNEFGVKRISKKLRRRVEECLKSEVTTYDQYLTGDVYGFLLEEKIACEACDHVDYVTIDSCFGFYGTKTLFDDIADQLDDEFIPLLEKLRKEAA